MAALLVLVAAACGTSDTSTAGSREGRTDAGATDLASGTWSTIPEAPLSPRADTGVIWAGDRLVVWSGSDPAAPGDDRPTDGATWTPGRGWQKMSDPLGAAALVPVGFAVWTGEEVVFGPVAPATAEERQGADPELLAYAPATDAWRRIQPDRAAATVLGDATQDFYGAAARVGDEILVGRTGGGSGQTRQPGRLVALDPATGTSRALDPGPFDASPYSDLSGAVQVTEAGDELLAAPNWAAEAWVLDPSGQGTWRPASPSPLDDVGLNQPVWVEREAFFLESSRPVAYDPTTDRWRTLADPPPDLPRARVDVPVTTFVRAGDQIFQVGSGYDPAADQWFALPKLPVDEEEVRVGAFVGWSGDALLLFGGGRFSCQVDAECAIDPGFADWAQSGWILAP